MQKDVGKWLLTHYQHPFYIYIYSYCLLTFKTPIITGTEINAEAIASNTPFVVATPNKVAPTTLGEILIAFAYWSKYKM